MPNKVADESRLLAFQNLILLTLQILHECHPLTCLYRIKETLDKENCSLWHFEFLYTRFISKQLDKGSDHRWPVLGHCVQKDGLSGLSLLANSEYTACPSSNIFTLENGKLGVNVAFVELFFLSNIGFIGILTMTEFNVLKGQINIV